MPDKANSLWSQSPQPSGPIPWGPRRPSPVERHRALVSQLWFQVPDPGKEAKVDMTRGSVALCLPSSSGGANWKRLVVRRVLGTGSPSFLCKGWAWPSSCSGCPMVPAPFQLPLFSLNEYLILVPYRARRQRKGGTKRSEGFPSTATQSCGRASTRQPPVEYQAGVRRATCLEVRRSPRLQRSARQEVRARAAISRVQSPIQRCGKYLHEPRATPETG